MLEYKRKWRAGSNTNSWARKKAIRWCLWAIGHLCSWLGGNVQFSFFRDLLVMKKMFSVGIERETKQLLKRTQARVKNVVLKNRVLLAFISDSGFETQQKEKWKWDLPAVMRKGVSSPALICPTGERWQWWAGVGRESEQCYKGRWWTYCTLTTASLCSLYCLPSVTKTVY